MSALSAAKLVRIAAPRSIDASSNLTVRPHAANEELVKHFRGRDRPER